MIPFTTTVVHGKQVKPWIDITCTNGNSQHSGHDYLKRPGAVSFEKRDSNTLHVNMSGKMEGCGKHDERRETRRSHSISLTDDDEKQSLANVGRKDYRPQFRERFLSMHQSPRKRRPLHILSPANMSLFDESYSGQVKCLLNKVGSWDFDIFKLDQLSNGRPVYVIAMHLFQHYNLINHFHLKIEKLLQCFRSIEEGYHVTNPYHNAIHAADVTQSMHCFLQQKQVMELLSPQDILVTLLASMSHDIDHPGVNNTFLVTTDNHLASLYNNISVLENHHYRTALSLLIQTGILEHFPSQQWHSFCDQMRSLILATDISRQQEFIASFRKSLDEGRPFKDSTAKYLMLQISLKCSDISNTCREWEVSKHWSDRVCDEFFKQGDCEKLLNLPITPMCNKSLTTTPNIQIGFMLYVVSPLLHEWQRWCPTNHSTTMMGNLMGNIQRWKQWGHDRNIPITDHTSGVVHDDIDDSMSTASGSSLHDIISSSLTPLPAEERVEITQYHSIVLGDTINNGTMSPGRSLSPVSEDFPSDLLMSAINKRRHSMPIAALRKEQTRLTIRRESFPRVHTRRRYSLPPRASVHYSTSYDQIINKLNLLETGGVNKSMSLDTLFSRPKVSNLSPNIETSQLISHLTKYQSLHCVTLKSSQEVHSTEPSNGSSDHLVSSSNGASTRRRASLPVSETAREYLTRQVVDIATLFSCLDPTSQSYARTLAAAKFYNSNGLSETTNCRSYKARSNSMFEMTKNDLQRISLLQQCSK